jgi:hypothetical protein
MSQPQRFVLHANDSVRVNVLANCKRFLDLLPADKSWRVEVSQYVKRRSDAQNKYLWSAVYGAFTAALPGWDKEDVHEYLLGECFGWETIDGLGRKKVKPLRRSSKLNKQDFAEYVDFCIRKGLEHGIFVPSPDGDIYGNRD